MRTDLVTSLGGLLRLWVALWLALAAGCGTYPEQNRVDLIAEFPFARQNFVVSGRGTVGRPAFRSFLGAGLRPQKEADWAKTETDQLVAGFGFFLYEARSVSILVSGKCAESKTVKFLSRGRLLGEGPLSPELSGLRLSISSDMLEPGMNWIELENAGGVEWRDFQVFPADSGLSIQTGLPVPASVTESGQLSLPFGQTISYALHSAGESRLELDLQDWTESGAPQPEASNLELSIRLLADSDASSQVLTISGAGTHTLELPSKLGDFGLELSPRFKATGGPLPGQLGLRLSRLSLGRSESTDELPSRQPSVTPPSDVSRPNVVICVIDTLRADRLGAYGYQHPTSPHFDALAADSVLFTQAVAEAPWTKPSVATLLTGLDSSGHGVLDFNDVLDTRHTTLAELLRSAGYQTFGVVANPLVGTRFGFGQGFDQYLGVPVTERATDLNHKAFELLEQASADRPFFLYLQPIDPHLPYDPPEPHRSRALFWNGLGESSEQSLLPSTDKAGFSRLTQHLFRQSALGRPPNVPSSTLDLVQALYDGEVATADAALGELVSWLKRRNLYDETLIVVTSDHGEELMERDWLGHMHSFYEELLRVPMLVKLPRGERKGSRETDPFHHQDVVATILHNVGLPKSDRWDGDPSRLSSARLSQMQAGADAVSAGQAHTEFLQKGAALRMGTWKLIHHDSSVKPGLIRGLFDLAVDPLERENLIFTRPLKVLQMERELARREKLTLEREEASKGSPEATRSILETLQYIR